MFEMRVPARFADVETREIIRYSLKTDSQQIAARKDQANQKMLIAKWEALQAGMSGVAADYEKAVVELCRASGFDYLSADTVAQMDLSPLLDRLETVSGADAIESDALIGGVAAVAIPVSNLLAFYEEVVAADLTAKDARQMKKWRNDRELVIGEFLSACGDMDVAAITREHVSKYRRVLTDRLVSGDLVQNSANRRIQALGRMVKSVLWDRQGITTEAFKEMGWREPKKKRRNTQVSYSPDFIRGRLLAPGALDGLNEDARDIVLVAMNTGAGPSELVNLGSDTIFLNAEVPYIDIRPDGRELKNVYRERQIPLTGVALEAMQRHPDGFQRYVNGDSVSNLINKYFRNNDLKETPEHTLKSLRHSFRDALRNAGCPDSVAEELMGHVQAGTVYGEGVWLSVAQDWLNRIAF